MAELATYQSQFEKALANAPSFLALDGLYVYKTEGSDYDPVTDTYSNTKVESVVIRCIRGLELVEGENRITFLTETRPFTFGKPSVNGQLAIGGEAWNIKSVRQDPIGLTYTFIVENKDGI